MNQQGFYRLSSIFFLLVSLLCGGCDKNTSPITSPDDELDRVAKRFEAAGDYQSSLSFYKQALDKSPQDASLRLKVGETAWKMGNYEESSFYAKSILETDPTSFEGRRLLARTLLAKEKGAEALPLLETLTKERPDDASLSSYLGVCLDMLGNHDAAQSLYRKALEHAPLNRGFTSNLGLSLTLSGHYKEAISLLEQVKSMPGASVRDRHNLALAYGLSGDLEKAEQIYSIDVDPTITRRNIERLATLNGNGAHAPAHVDTPELLESLRTQEEQSPSPSTPSEPKTAVKANTPTPKNEEVAKQVSQIASLSAHEQTPAPQGIQSTPTTENTSTQNTPSLPSKQGSTEEENPYLVDEKDEKILPDQTSSGELEPLDLTATDSTNKG